MSTPEEKLKCPCGEEYGATAGFYGLPVTCRCGRIYSTCTYDMDAVMRRIDRIADALARDVVKKSDLERVLMGRSIPEAPTVDRSTVARETPRTDIEEARQLLVEARDGLAAGNPLRTKILNFLDEPRPPHRPMDAIPYYRVEMIRKSYDAEIEHANRVVGPLRLNVEHAESILRTIRYELVRAQTKGEFEPLVNRIDNYLEDFVPGFKRPRPGEQAEWPADRPRHDRHRIDVTPAPGDQCGGTKRILIGANQYEPCPGCRACS